MVLSVLDVDTRLLSHGVPANTWFVGKPVYDLKCADDRLLFDISINVVEELFKHLQVEASLYGLLLNLTKIELLRDPKYQNETLQFANGNPVPTTDSANFLAPKFRKRNPQ